MLLKKLEEAGVIHPPTWMVNNTAYMTMMGSVSHGVSTDDSDVDIYGFAFPPKDNIFPHLSGEIPGFGNQTKPFNVWLQHHIPAPGRNDKEYDIQIFSIIKYFQLCMDCSPNVIDSLFTPEFCVLHSTQIGNLVRENRKLFLSKAAYSTFKGYSYSQLNKIRNKTNAKNEKRSESIKDHGYDIKFAVHLIRLLLEVEQILTHHDLDIQLHREHLKSVKRGDLTIDQVEEFFTDKARNLENLYATSTLREVPDEAAIRDLLFKCIEIHYGKISATVQRGVSVEKMLEELRNVIDRHSANY